MDPETTKLFQLVKGGNLEGLKDFVEDAEVRKRKRDSLLDAVDWLGWTVLHRAAIHNHPSIIQWLLSSEEGGGRAAGFTNVLAKDKKENTALHCAAHQGYWECCQALVEGSNVENGERAALLNAVNEYGWTVLHYAAFYKHPTIIKWLLSSEEGGGRAAGFTSSSITAITMKGRESVLHLAVYSGSVECLNALLSGCTVGERLTLFLQVDEHGWTALHHAACFNKPETIRELLLRYPETQTIVNHRDHRGMTALHRAVIGGVDEDSRKEWGLFRGEKNYGRAGVVAALLTVPKKADNDKNDGKQRQQAAMVDPNLGTKME